MSIDKISKLNYKKQGTIGTATVAKNRPAILILHGLFGNLKNWQTIANHLALQQQVYSLDLRNHGLSPHTLEMNYEVMAADIKQFILEHNLEKVNILAHSMGGKAAMHLALHNEALINKLIIVDIAPVTYQHGFDTIFDALLTLPLDKIQSKSLADAVLSQKIKDKMIRQFLLLNLSMPTNKVLKKGVSKKQAQWLFNLEALHKNIDKIIAFPEIADGLQYTSDCLFIAGMQSDYITKENTKSIKNYFPKAKIVTVKHAGHWLHAEKPEILKNILDTYL